MEMKLVTDNAESILRLHKVYMSNVKYSCDADINEENEKKYSFKCKIKAGNEAYFYITLETEINIDGTDTVLEVGVCGEFSLVSSPESERQLKDLLTQNTIAILFPYLRAYVSNFSSMTNLGMVNLPVFNVAKMFSQSHGRADNNRSE